MKKLLLTVALVMAVVGAYAQGTINLTGFSPAAGVNVQVSDAQGNLLEGDRYQAAFFVGTDAASLTQLDVSAPFRTGAGAGYWNPSPTTANVPDLGQGTEVFAQVFAWDTQVGATLDDAMAAGTGYGMSNVIGGPGGGIALGGGINLPPNLVGLESFSLIPEPTTIALGLLGGLALLLRRRRNK